MAVMVLDPYMEKHILASGQGLMAINMTKSGKESIS